MPGYQVFYSPAPVSHNNGKTFLPRSCLFVPNLLMPQHPPVCNDIKFLVLSVSFCFIRCRGLLPLFINLRQAMYWRLICFVLSVVNSCSVYYLSWWFEYSFIAAIKISYGLCWLSYWFSIVLLISIANGSQHVTMTLFTATNGTQRRAIEECIVCTMVGQKASPWLKQCWEMIKSSS